MASIICVLYPYHMPHTHRVFDQSQHFQSDNHPLGCGSCFRDKNTVLAVSRLADVTKRLRITGSETSSNLLSLIEK